ncbi:MAG TPA: hypothetical protein PKC29_12970 [Thermodesulfobacteriota bacterium]|nr:hypothetical protein [Thermodesulfobacteriota bacterium]
MKTKHFNGAGSARLYLLVIAALACLILLLIASCGGGGSESETGTRGGQAAASITPLGIEFRHMDYYTPDELTDAVRTVDDYYGLVVNCVIENHPDLEEEVLSLEPSDISVVVVTPTLYDQQKGKEGFPCKYHETGCSGSYNLGGSINVTPALDALGQEMAHWMNYMLLGDTSDDDPGDFSVLCNIKSICHLYSETRNLRACRTEE